MAAEQQQRWEHAGGVVRSFGSDGHPEWATATLGRTTFRQRQNDAAGEIVQELVDQRVRPAHLLLRHPQS